MELNRVIQTLRVSLQDLNNEVYDESVIIEGIWEAIQAYSYYRGTTKRVGESKLQVPAIAGALGISVIGGNYLPGDTITIDVLGQFPERVTVTSVEVAPPSGFNSNLIDTILFSPALQYSHPKQALVIPNEFGVKITSGLTYFPLPRDFIKFDKHSLDDALGVQTTSEKGIGYFDAVYTISEQYSWLGWGYRTDFGGIWSGGYYPFIGNPLDNPNGGVNSSSFPSNTTLTVSRTDRPFLRVSPMATGSTYLDCTYIGTPALDDIPDNELIGIVSYARYFALSSRAAKIGSMMDYSEADVSEHPSSTAQMLLVQAKESLEQFHRHFRLHPYITSG